MPMTHTLVTLADIEAAAIRIRPAARVTPLICMVPVHVPPPDLGAAVTVTLPKNCDSGAFPDTCPENVACQPDHEGSVKRMVPSIFRSD